MGGLDRRELVGGRRGDQSDDRDDHVKRRLLHHALPTSLLPRPAPVEHPVGYGAGKEGDDGGGDRPHVEPAEAHEQHDGARNKGHHGPGAVAPQTYSHRRAPTAQPVGADQPVQRVSVVARSASPTCGTGASAVRCTFLVAQHGGQLCLGSAVRFRATCRPALLADLAGTGSLGSCSVLRLMLSGDRRHSAFSFVEPMCGRQKGTLSGNRERLVGTVA